MLKYDEGPCFNWPPSEMLDMTDNQVKAYAKLLVDTRATYAQQMEASMNKLR